MKFLLLKRIRRFSVVDFLIAIAALPAVWVMRDKR